ncbi:TPA: response regulator [Vibrio campbellii]|nr:response regulator [Vibrio campbellii]
MTENFITHMLYSKAIVLILVSFLVLIWTFFFFRALYLKKRLNKIVDYKLYLLHIIGLYLWILSNAYFHSGLLPLYSKQAAIKMAIIANISAYIAFAAAYLFSCRLRASISGKRLPNWQYITLICSAAFTATMNSKPSLAINDIIISSPSNFIIKFGPATKIFFFVLIFLVAQTFINLLFLRKRTGRIGQTKLNYMIAGVGVFMTSTSIIQMGFTYILNDFSLTWIPPALSISILFSIGYALLNSRFYSVKYLLFTILSFIVTSAMFALSIYSFIPILTPFNDIIVACALCMLVGLSWAKVLYVVERVIARIIYGSPYTPVEKILALEHDFQHSSQGAIKKLAELLNIPQKKLQLVTNPFQDSAYTEYLSSNKNILIVDEIANELSCSKSNNDEKLSKLHTKMHLSETALVLPLYDHDTTISHLLLSSHKNGGGLFTYEEINALKKVFSKAQTYINADRKISQSQTLANSIAHEMRNPLAKVQLQFETLKQHIENQASVEQIKLDIENGQAAIQRGRQLIDIILREVSDSSLEREPVAMTSIHRAVDQALSRYGFENEEVIERIRLSQHNDFVAKLNEILFNFVIFNLIRNAIYYFDSYPDSQIEISTKTGPYENTLIFRDTGPGINETISHKIFDDFFSYQKSGGSGLGLGYCQRVMRSFGGRIECESKLGEFTEFHLYFPVVPNAPKADTLRTPYFNDWKQNKRSNEHKVVPNVQKTNQVPTVLIVDDKKVQRALVQMYLNQLGVNSLQANNGENAVEVFKTNHVDFILMDVQMPVMNGLDASQKIKELSPQTPIVALSGESGERELDMINKIMDGRLEKPTTLSALRHVLGNWLNKDTASSACEAERE